VKESVEKRQQAKERTEKLLNVAEAGMPNWYPCGRCGRNNAIEVCEECGRPICEYCGGICYPDEGDHERDYECLCHECAVMKGLKDKFQSFDSMT